jgi:LuxR family maltose regulon positive regulatory protein
MLPAGAQVEKGRAALDRGAWQAACEAFRTALEEKETAEALEGLGQALYWLDRTAESLGVRERAFRLRQAAGERRAAARLACELALDSWDLRGEAPANGWLEQARRLLEGLEPGPEHGWLALWEGHFALLLRHDAARARESAKAAQELARRHGPHELETLAAALEGLVLVAEGSVPEGMRRLDGATAAALRGAPSALGAVGATCCFLVHACQRVRDYERAAQWALEVERFSRQWGIEPALAVCRTQYAALLVGRGEWERAEEELARAAERLAGSRPLLLSEALEQTADLRRRQGRWEEAEELYSRVEGRSLALLGRGAMAVDRGHFAEARDLLDRFLRRTSPDNWTGRAQSLELLVRACLSSGDRAGADEARARLRELATRVDTPAIRATSHLAEARLLEADGRAEDARRRFEDAVDAFLQTQAPWEAARARLDLAACLARAGRGRAAAAEREAALDSLRGLGAEAEAARLAGASTGPAPLAPSDTGLTARELEVLRLVARGLSDKEIADRLHLSGHTVHRHVSNVRVKLGLPSRAAAVAWAAERGLL